MMNISDTPKPYLAAIKLILISLIFGSSANLAKYIYNL